MTLKDKGQSSNTHQVLLYVFRALLMYMKVLKLIRYLYEKKELKCIVYNFKYV